MTAQTIAISESAPEVVTLDGMLKSMPLHQNFYLRGIMNSFIPAFMGGTDRVLTEDALSGEAVEMLRSLVTDIAGDMPNGYSTSITYDDINEKYNLKNMSSLFVSLIDRYTEDQSQQVTLNLPKLKKVDGNTETPELKLPKLKKITEKV